MQNERAGPSSPATPQQPTSSQLNAAFCLGYELARFHWEAIRAIVSRSLLPPARWLEQNQHFEDAVVACKQINDAAGRINFDLSVRDSLQQAGRRLLERWQSDHAQHTLRDLKRAIESEASSLFSSHSHVLTDEKIAWVYQKQLKFVDDLWRSTADTMKAAFGTAGVLPAAFRLGHVVGRGKYDPPLRVDEFTFQDNDKYLPCAFHLPWSQYLEAQNRFRVSWQGGSLDRMNPPDEWWSDVEAVWPHLFSQPRPVLDGDWMVMNAAQRRKAVQMVHCAAAKAITAPENSKAARRPDLQESQQNAFHSFVYAMDSLNMRSTYKPCNGQSNKKSREPLYRWLEALRDKNELKEYRLPIFSTWDKYVRTAIRYYLDQERDWPSGGEARNALGSD